MTEHDVLAPYSGSAIPHVGTYRRVLPVTLERMYENALDWAHLPHIHASSFASIECMDAGAWGWRASVTDTKGRASVIELQLDKTLRRWITRNLEGSNQGAEIWTHAFAVDTRRVDINVDFFVPGVAPAAREKVGQAYARAYTTLGSKCLRRSTQPSPSIWITMNSWNHTAPSFTAVIVPVIAPPKGAPQRSTTVAPSPSPHQSPSRNANASKLSVAASSKLITRI